MRACLVAVALCLLAFAPPATAAGEPAPGSPEYVERDNQNIRDAYGRQTGYQLTPQFTKAIVQEHTEVGFNQLAQQLAQPNRLAITPGNVFPGWNGGNPLRRGWSGTRGLRIPVSYTNRFGALIRGSVFAPLPAAKDPYTGARLAPPYPGVVLTTGSVQGSERMYHWLAEDLAERGFVVLVYDVQGQGTSETAPHENDQVNALPFCNPFAAPQEGEQFGCPGVPSQQEANFVKGTQDALDWFLATPDKPYPNRNGGDAPVNAFNPLHDQVAADRIGIVGHSLGAAAISYVQGIDQRVDAVVALDKLNGGDSEGIPSENDVKPRVPALAIQSEYGFNVFPYWMAHGSSIAQRPGPPDQRPDPRREVKTGFDAWKKAGVDVMTIVPRASTHLDYTDIAYALPASRYGQALSSVYTQAWLERYLKPLPAVAGAPGAKKARHVRSRYRGPRWRSQWRWRGGKARAKRRSAAVPSADALLAGRFTYLEPTDVGRWEPIQLERKDLLSFYFCSAYAFGGRADGDIGKVGGC